VTPAVLLLAFVTAERLAELWLARRNTAALLAKGAYEVAPGHYPLIVLLHAVWLAGLWVFGWANPLNMGWLAMFLVLQVLRVWVLTTLGRRWTTRIIVLPGAPGDNGALSVFVASELSRRDRRDRRLPLCLGLPWYAVAFSDREPRGFGDPRPRGECVVGGPA
jgi:methyltransferase